METINQNNVHITTIDQSGTRNIGADTPYYFKVSTFFCTNKGLNKSIGIYLRSKFSSFSQKELTRGRTSELPCTVIFEELKLLQILTMIQILNKNCLPLKKKVSLPQSTGPRFDCRFFKKTLHCQDPTSIMCRTVY
jgi:hypothetical protein